jgi:hypothetical protein
MRLGAFFYSFLDFRVIEIVIVIDLVLKVAGYKIGYRKVMFNFNSIFIIVYGF